MPAPPPESEPAIVTAIGVEPAIYASLAAREAEASRCRKAVPSARDPFPPPA
ncbi:hypothetical protein GCM10017643_12670 [Ancylobacter dichloromethanicus]|uniref:Uncharacterized protein n=1 Tax=Ancylobacter dichloromethanicus TaxID=518825 RepID=A0A9W6J6A2_9HYPH|nr:hypothetical protein GCM10017643_12670 [Ancylobacter dichloromethanicus]